MIKSVTFDLGGVLFSEGKSVALEKLNEDYSYDEEVVMDVLTSPESFELRKGNISDEDFWNSIQAGLPKKYDANLIRNVWYDSYILDEKVLDIVKRLKEDYTLLVYSGNIESRIDYLDQKYDFRKHFDKEIYTYDYHLYKDDKKFAKTLLKVAECNPEEIVYVDDQKKYAKYAVDLGIKVIIHEPKKKNLEEELIKKGVVL